jgi:hypothetical protein
LLSAHVPLNITLLEIKNTVAFPCCLPIRNGEVLALFFTPVARLSPKGAQAGDDLFR